MVEKDANWEAAVALQLRLQSGGISIADLARRSGLSKATIQRIVSGQTLPNPRTRARLEFALDGGLGTVRQRLRAAREQIGLSREALAARLSIDLAQIAAHETGKTRVSEEEAEAYARELEVTVAWLLYGDEGAPHPAPAPDVPSTIKMTALDNGEASLELSITLPFPVVLKILALIEEARPASP